jgi:hypothetical protein
VIDPTSTDAVLATLGCTACDVPTIRPGLCDVCRDANGPFKYAGFSGPHPTLIVDCPTCGSPAGYYCNDEPGHPVDGPHQERRIAAATA